MPTNTTNFSLKKPIVGADENAWGGYINDNLDDIDGLLGDGAPLAIDTTNNRVGIGTTSPLTLVSAYGTNVAKYSLQSGSGVGGGFIGWYDNTGTRQQYIGTGSNTDSEFRIYQEANDDMVFATNSIARMRIMADGDVGIGTASPASALDVVGTITGDGLTINTAQGDVTVESATSSLSFDRAGASYLRATDAAGRFIFVTGANDFSTSRMQISSNGDVSLYEDTGTSAKFFWDASAERLGLGTNSPDAELHIVGGTPDILIEDSANGSQALISYDGAAGAGLTISADVNSSAANSKIAFEVDGAEQARISASGDLLVGTTDTTLYNNTTGEGVIIRGGGNLQIANDAADCVRLNRMTSTGQIVYFYQAGTNVGNISVTGSATAYNTSSDYRLKEDWQPMTGAADRVLDLKPVNFAWKADGSRVDGFLAHELGDVVPEAVTGVKDEVDDEGNPVYQGIDQSKLVPLLTAALQEALTKIDALETRIAALEG